MLVGAAMEKRNMKSKMWTCPCCESVLTAEQAVMEVCPFCNHLPCVAIPNEKRALDAKLKLIRDMLKTLDDLGQDPMARIDARVCADYYRKKAAKLVAK